MQLKELKVKRIIVIGNPTSEATQDLIRASVNFLNECGCACVFMDFGASDLRKKEGYDATVYPADMALVFGGDGTILNACRKLVESDIPVLGINLGHLGYLAAAEPNGCIETLKKVVYGDYTVERRITLEAEINGKKYLGVNEAVLDRGGSPHLVKVTVSVNGHEVDFLRADGMMVATPTGSTAYNLSAGGPVVVPTARTLVMTPICAHSLAARPIVVGEEDVISLQTSAGQDDAFLSLDGITVGAVKAGSKIVVRKGKSDVLLVRTGENKFFATLRKKLSCDDQY